MKILMSLILVIQVITAATFYTDGNGGWLNSGGVPTDKNPGPKDDIVIQHDYVWEGDFSNMEGSLTVMAPATLIFESEVTFNSALSVKVDSAAYMVFEKDWHNYSTDFYNYGEVYYYAHVFNHGNIQSYGFFYSNDEGRQFHNGDGVFNDLIGGNGPGGVQDYKYEELNQSVPNGGVVTPVVWGDISAEVRGANLKVEWEVYSESNNDYFYIVASTNGYNWDTLGTVKGQGTSNEFRKYQFENITLNDYHFVGVGQVDFDGSHDFGGMVELTNSSEMNYLIQNNRVTLFSSSAFEVYSLSGKKVSNLQITQIGTAQEIDFSGMSGVFIISIQNAYSAKNIKVYIK